MATYLLDTSNDISNDITWTLEWVEKLLPPFHSCKLWSRNLQEVGRTIFQGISLSSLFASPEQPRLRLHVTVDHRATVGDISSPRKS